MRLLKVKNYAVYDPVIFEDGVNYTVQNAVDRVPCDNNNKTNTKLRLRDITHQIIMRY